MMQKDYGKKLKLKKVTVAFLSEKKMNNIRGGDMEDPFDSTIDTSILSEPTGPTAYDSSCTCLIVEHNLFRV